MFHIQNGIFPKLSTVEEVSKPDAVRPSIVDGIANAIRAAGYASHEEFAHVIGLPKSTLSRLLSGKADPRLSTLERIAEGLELSLVSLLGGAVGQDVPKRKQGRPSKQAITLTITVPPGTKPEDWFRLAAEECRTTAPKGRRT